jgi:hypothetical protein
VRPPEAIGIIIIIVIIITPAISPRASVKPAGLAGQRPAPPPTHSRTCLPAPIIPWKFVSAPDAKGSDSGARKKDRERENSSGPDMPVHSKGLDWSRSQLPCVCVSVLACVFLFSPQARPREASGQGRRHASARALGAIGLIFYELVNISRPRTSTRPKKKKDHHLPRWERSLTRRLFALSGSP